MRRTGREFWSPLECCSAGRVSHRANVLDDGVAAVDRVVDESQVGPDVACSRREIALAQLYDDAYVVAVNHAGRQ